MSSQLHNDYKYNLTDREKLCLLTGYLKGHQYSILAREDNSLHNTKITFRLLHNIIRDKLYIQEQKSDFYKSLADMLDEFESITHVQNNTKNPLILTTN